MNNTEKLAKIALKKSLLKEYSNSQNDRIVYLNNGDEFQIQFFNPFTYSIGAEIYLNDQCLSNKIVIRPGERIWLERYLDSPRKFKFDIYKVNNSKSVKEAIANNGDVKIKFYQERNQTPWSSIVVSKNADNSFNWEYNKTYPTWTTSSNLYNSSITSASTYTSTYASTYTACNTLPSTIETGRIEKGNHSNQNLDYVNIDFEFYPFKTENIKLLPVSQKPIGKNDLKKLYCTECGRKIKDKFKFCPYCGAILS